MGLWHDFEMAVGSGRSTLGSEIRKRIEEISLICHHCWRQSMIANRVAVFSSLFRRMILDLTQDSRESSYV